MEMLLLMDTQPWNSSVDCCRISDCRLPEQERAGRCGWAIVSQMGLIFWSILGSLSPHTSTLLQFECALSCVQTERMDCESEQLCRF